MCMQNLNFVALPVPEIIGVPEKWAVPGYAHAYFSLKFFMGFVRMDALNILAKFEIRNFSRSWDNRGYPNGYAHAPFSLKFLMGFCSDGPSECTGQI